MPLHNVDTSKSIGIVTLLVVTEFCESAIEAEIQRLGKSWESSSVDIYDVMGNYAWFQMDLNN